MRIYNGINHVYHNRDDHIFQFHHLLEFHQRLSGITSDSIIQVKIDF